MSQRRFFHLLFHTLVLVLWACTPEPEPAAGEYATLRQQMIQAIEADVRVTSRYIGKTRLDPQIMAVMARMPRHEFVPETLRESAYENRPQPIGQGQTISQPYIVALMTDMLALESDAVVLEVGTGSGYQAAVLGELASTVYSIEIVEALGIQARERLNRLGYDNIQVRIGDGYAGWPEQAPFDAIIVTAAAEQIPEPLIEQLKPGGRMAIPVGAAWSTQELILLSKDEDGQVSKRSVLPVAFVPLTGDR